MNIRLAVCLVALTISAACTPDPLPGVPAVATEDMRPVARDQIRKAYADAEARKADIEAVAELAFVLHAYGFEEEAEIAYRRALALRPTDARLIYLHASVLHALGQLIPALERYRAMSEDPEFGPRSLARIADILILQNEWAGAREAAERGLAIMPADPELNYHNARALMQLGKNDEAMASIQRALSAGAGQPAVHFVAAQVARATGNAEAAARHLTEFERMRTRQSRWPDKLMQAVESRRLTARSRVEASRQMLADGGNVREAISMLKLALESDPEAYEAHIPLIGLFTSIGRADLAEPHIQRALALAPDTAQLHFNIGTARLAQERLQEAAQAFGRAIELDQTNAMARVLLGEVRLRQNRNDEAMDLLRQALRLAPANPLVREQALKLMTRWGQHGEALELLAKPESQPEPEVTRQLARARILHESGNHVAAHEALAEAAHIAVNNGNAELADRVAATRKALLTQNVE